MGSRDILFARPDGSEVLVTIWDDGTVTLAERTNSGASWGPPLTGTEQ